MLKKEIIIWLANHEGELYQLSLRDRLILRLRYGIRIQAEHTLEEIGDAVGLTRQRVNQIEKDALLKLGLLDK